MTIRPFPTLLLCGFCLSLAACGSVTPGGRPAARVEPLSIQVSEHLYFGRTIPTGGFVSDEAWAAFLAEVVTPRFPAGLTVWHGDGQWRGADGKIAKEQSYVLDLLHPDDAASDRSVREIMAEYRRRFSQEAVLRIREHVEAGF